MQELINLAGQYADRDDPQVVQALSNMARLITTISNTVSGIHDDLEALKYDTNKDLFTQAEKTNEALEKMWPLVWGAVGASAFFSLITILDWIF